MQRRVLIIGADGLRPDQLDSSLMPTVVHLALNGVRCWDHHAVYPTHTRVNISALASGSTPGRHGIVANTMLVANATEDHIIDTSNYQHINALEHASRSPRVGPAILVPTLGDLLAARGERLAVAGTSSAGAGMLWSHRHLDRIVNTNTAYGIADLYDLREKLGEIPEREEGAQIARQQYATDAVIRLYLDDPANRVIVLWFNEPDSSQHYFGLGSPEALASLRGVDACVAKLLAALESRGLRDQFDIFFISDHGHSTVRAHNTLRTYLAEAFDAIGYRLPLTTASDYIYVQPGASFPTPQQLVPLIDWLVAQPWTGVVMVGHPAYERIPGVIPLHALWGDHRNQRMPLLAVSPRWSHAPNEHGIPGEVMSLTTQAALRSSHGSASPFDLHALFIANGPSFVTGANSQIPTGAIDLLPTILTVLDIDIPMTVDGRVLWEIFAAPQGEPGSVQRETLEPNTENRNALLTPQVALHRVGTVRYVHGALQENAFFPPPGPRS
ncbi:MAG: alkaline phosphatase family protein [Caldilineaceae bacterium]|nr:alkaline phosphatase family protein [Caldilineaceae bacterium]